jgi:hypothetical protein
LTSLPILVASEVIFMLQYVSCSASSVQAWARENFSGARLRDPRRVRRAQIIAQGMAQSAGLSVPALFDSPYDVKAAYSFFDRPEGTPDAIQAGHRDAVRDALGEPGTSFLLIEDTSAMTWPGKDPVPGLGPVGDGKKGLQGFLLHTTLAVRWSDLPMAEPNECVRRPPVLILGLADQIFHVRKPRPQGEIHGDHKARRHRERESGLWTKAIERLGPAPNETRWERVADRESDIYEYLRACLESNQGFIVRACQDRTLLDPQTGKPAGHLFAAVRGTRSLGTFDLHLRARPTHAERTAKLSVAACPVVLRAPYRPGYALGTLPEVACWAVRVFEADPAQGTESVEWIILHDRPVPSFETAREVALKYSTRWLIEEFHKALKTGLGAERLQLERARRLFAAIALMSVVALRLIDLRERVRLTPDAPAEESGLTPLELEVLRARLRRPIKTVREAALALGRLGGHMNRRADGPPGWKSLWVGRSRLQLLVQGYHLAQQKQRSFGE